MQLDPFRMERWQSKWEHKVRINLTESGAHPLPLADVIEVGPLLDAPCAYPPTGGSIRLRRAIAALYPEAGPENVLVTTGTVEANFLALWRLVEPNARVGVMLPNYEQVPNLVRGLGGRVQGLPLRPVDGTWSLDSERLASLCEETRLIAVCNPNNPTGMVLSEEEMSQVCSIAERSGAWILSDEVYRGAELRTRRVTPTFWGRTERVLATGGLSKAYALPGLRVGWVVGPSSMIEELWSYKDYVTISVGSMSDAAAGDVLRSPLRERLLARNRNALRKGLQIVEAWLEEEVDLVEGLLPDAGGFCFIRSRNSDIDTAALAEYLRLERELLVVPGDHFDLPGWIRIGFGTPPGLLREGLGILAGALQDRA